MDVQTEALSTKMPPEKIFFFFLKAYWVPCCDPPIFPDCWQSLSNSGLTCPQRPLDTLASPRLSVWLMKYDLICVAAESSYTSRQPTVFNPNCSISAWPQNSPTLGKAEKRRTIEIMSIMFSWVYSVLIALIQMSKLQKGTATTNFCWPKRCKLILPTISKLPKVCV